MMGVRYRAGRLLRECDVSIPASAVLPDLLELVREKCGDEALIGITAPEPGFEVAEPLRYSGYRSAGAAFDVKAGEFIGAIAEHPFAVFSGGSPAEFEAAFKEAVDLLIALG